MFEFASCHFARSQKMLLRLVSGVHNIFERFQLEASVTNLKNPDDIFLCKSSHWFLHNESISFKQVKGALNTQLTHLH